MAYDSWKLTAGESIRAQRQADACANAEAGLESSLNRAADQVNQSSAAQWSVSEVLADADDDEIRLEVSIRIQGLTADARGYQVGELAERLMDLGRRLAAQSQGESLPLMKMAPSARSRGGEGRQVDIG